jgi:fatty-acid peroxygenase
MVDQRGLHFDDTLGLALGGYAWLPALRRRQDNDGIVSTRLLGMRTVALQGPEAMPFFYDDSQVRRHTAIPEPVQGTLFGHGAIHTLDGSRHRRRKAMFLSVLKDRQQIRELTDRVAAAWDEAVPGWAAGEQVVLFDEAARVISRAVFAWSGVPVEAAEVAGAAADLTALVDGFATGGPRHWRARRARGRWERRLAALIEQVRAGQVVPRAGSPLSVVAHYADIDGETLSAKHAAVELLNMIRPTVAVSWFVAFSAHALHLRPELRSRLREGGLAYAVAFAHEVRRFYPFAPFVGGRAVRDLTWRDVRIPAGSMVLLDLYGQAHDANLWPQPYSFDPERFLNREPAPDELVPQGGGDACTGHRCPGEDVTVALLATLAGRLAELDYEVPEQDLTISLRRIPALPRSRFVMRLVRPGDRPQR